MDYESIDAEELWQIISNYAQGGRVVETKDHLLSADDKEGSPGYTLWAVDKDGEQCGGWYPERQEIDALQELGIIEPEVWRKQQTSDGEIREYKLTAEGQRLAALNEDEVIAYLAQRNIHRLEHGDASWG